LGRALSLAYTTRHAVENGAGKIQELIKHLPGIGRVVPDAPPPHARYSIYDHLPANYVACSQPDGVLTEFGDDF
jgi:hypothetical protein